MAEAQTSQNRMPAIAGSPASREQLLPRQPGLCMHVQTIQSAVLNRKLCCFGYLAFLGSSSWLHHNFAWAGRGLLREAAGGLLREEGGRSRGCSSTAKSQQAECKAQRAFFEKTKSRDKMQLVEHALQTAFPDWQSICRHAFTA